MRTPRLAIIAFACLVLGALVVGGCGSVDSPSALKGAPEEAVLGTAEVVLPTRRCANYFLVEAYLNGRGPFTLVLDTGASQTVVSPRIAELLKDDARPVDLYAEGSQGKRQDIRSVVRVRELRLGEAKLHGFDAITLDLSKIQATLGARVDGILGYPAFGDVLLTIDYPNSTVKIARGSLAEPDGRRVLRLADSDRPTIIAQVNGKKRRLLIDSGKAGGFSLSNFESQEFLNPPATIALGVAIGGSFVLRAGRLAGDITFGDVTYRRPVVEDSDASDLIGAEAMKSFAVVFDARRRRVAFEKSGERTIESPPIRGIGVGFDFTQGSWDVGQVFPGQPAEIVGILPGDAVVRLGGKRTRELACTRPMEAFSVGDSIDVAIIRQRRRMEFKVPIITLVP